MENNKVLVILPYNSLEAEAVLQALYSEYDTNIFIPLVKFIQMQHNDYTSSLLLAAEFATEEDFENKLCFGLCKKFLGTFTHIIAYKQYTCSVQEDILKQRNEYAKILYECYTSEDATEDYKTIEELKERISQLLEKKEG